MTASRIVGIDPGVNTGFAIWHCDRKELIEVATMGITVAMKHVQVMERSGSLKRVVFEDARLRKWFGTKGAEAAQGAGSIKRDCSIWEEFLSGLTGIPFQMVSPKGKGKKIDAATFVRLTKWDGRTSEHARDAAMLVLGAI